MGNCVVMPESEAAVIEHPDGRIEKVYFSLTAAQAMLSSPGHYVALVTTSTQYGSTGARHLELLRPDDALGAGHVYRLISFEEILKLKESGSNKLMRVKRPPMDQNMSEAAPVCTDVEEMRHPTELISTKRRDRSKFRIISQCGCLPYRGSDESKSASGMLEKQQMEGMQKTKSLTRHGGFGGLKFKQWRPTLHSITEIER